MLIKKFNRFYLSKSRNFDLLNYKNGYKVIRNKIKTNYVINDFNISYIDDFNVDSFFNWLYRRNRRIK